MTSSHENFARNMPSQRMGGVKILNSRGLCIDLYPRAELLSTTGHACKRNVLANRSLLRTGTSQILTLNAHVNCVIYLARYLQESTSVRIRTGGPHVSDGGSALLQHSGPAACVSLDFSRRLQKISFSTHHSKLNLLQTYKLFEPHVTSIIRD